MHHRSKGGREPGDIAVIHVIAELPDHREDHQPHALQLELHRPVLLVVDLGHGELSLAAADGDHDGQILVSLDLPVCLGILVDDGAGGLIADYDLALHESEAVEQSRIKGKIIQGVPRDAGHHVHRLLLHEGSQQEGPQEIEQHADKDQHTGHGSHEGIIDPPPVLPGAMHGLFLLLLMLRRRLPAVG